MEALGAAPRVRRAWRAALVGLAGYGIVAFLGGEAERGVVCVWLAAVLPGAMARVEKAVRARLASAAIERPGGGAARAAEALRVRARRWGAADRGVERPAGDVAAAAYRAQSQLVLLAWGEAALAIAFALPLGKAALATALFAVATSFMYKTGAVLAAGRAPPGWRARIYVQHWLAFFLALVATAGSPEAGLSILFGYHVVFVVPALAMGALEARMVAALKPARMPASAPVWPFYVAALLAALNVAGAVLR